MAGLPQVQYEPRDENGLNTVMLSLVRRAYRLFTSKREPTLEGTSPHIQKLKSRAICRMINILIRGIELGHLSGHHLQSLHSPAVCS